MAEGCPGADGLVCVGGYLYSQFTTRMMIFPTNKKCPVCNPPKEDDETTGIGTAAADS